MKSPAMIEPLNLTVSWPAKANLFGVEISLTNYRELTTSILTAASLRQSAVVSCHAVHALVTASDDEVLREQVNTFEAISPDGQPVRWALNWFHKARLTDRVYGPHLMLCVCQAAAEQSIPIFLYGGTPEVLQKLINNLCERFPDLPIAGSFAPPFRGLTAEEDKEVVARITQSNAGIVFIGLGCPKQDFFAYQLKPSVNAVQICVGAAFDFHAGVKPIAPAWMQQVGLEWLFRLSQEPKRLWKRYLYTNLVFILKCLHFKK